MKGEDLSVVKGERQRSGMAGSKGTEEVVAVVPVFNVEPTRPSKRAFPQSFASRGPVTIVHSFSSRSPSARVSLFRVSGLFSVTLVDDVENEVGPSTNLWILASTVRLGDVYVTKSKRRRRDHAGARQPLRAGIRRVPFATRR